MWRSSLPKLLEAQFVAIDTETTGLQPAVHRLVEIGAVRFDRTGTVSAEFAELINPGVPIPPEAREIHGITDTMVCSAPGPKDVLPRFLQFVSGPNVVLVAHNALFDMAFVAMALARIDLAPPDIPVLDTRVLARKLLPELRGYSLRELATWFGLPLVNHHRALPDADLVRQVFCLMLSYVDPHEFGRLPEEVNVFSFEDAAIAPVEPPEGFDDLARALEEGGDVLIRYSGGTRSLSWRRVTPIALYRRGRHIYLTAWCHLDRIEKDFRLDRVAGLRVAEQPPT